MPVSNPQTFSSEEFAAAMGALEWRGDAMALAVSGGPDSMALALLLRDWARTQNIRLIAFTVDHGLREESAAEAARVHEWLAALGIDHEILRWEHPPLAKAVQEQARDARHRLLREACIRHDVAALALGHHRDDQAETVLMRFAKGSGIDGLAGMRPVYSMDGLTLLRPLLGMPKARLIATCVARGQAYVSDPSNAHAHYARGRLRGAADALAAEGMDAERLADLAGRAALASDALAEYTARLLARAARFDAAGYAELNIEETLKEPEEIRTRALGEILQIIGGAAYPPRHHAMMDVSRALQAGDMPRRTLHGCEIALADGSCRIIREFSAIRDRNPVKPGETVLWDHRFRVGLAAGAPDGLIVAPLGLLDHEKLDSIAPGLRKKIPMGRVRAAHPALWRGAELWAVPGWHEYTVIETALAGGFACRNGFV
ncbi:MAG: tRNA lysidine(34) synthetase TilS [Alphaproteobacteria bacterium]